MKTTDRKNSWGIFSLNQNHPSSYRSTYKPYNQILPQGVVKRLKI
jgi:hypothetical protein